MKKAKWYLSGLLAASLIAVGWFYSHSLSARPMPTTVRIPAVAGKLIEPQTGREGSPPVLADIPPEERPLPVSPGLNLPPIPAPLEVGHGLPMIPPLQTGPVGMIGPQSLPPENAPFGILPGALPTPHGPIPGGDHPNLPGGLNLPPLGPTPLGPHLPGLPTPPLPMQPLIPQPMAPHLPQP